MLHLVIACHLSNLKVTKQTKHGYFEEEDKQHIQTAQKVHQMYMKKICIKKYFQVLNASPIMAFHFSVN